MALLCELCLCWVSGGATNSPHIQKWGLQEDFWWLDKSQHSWGTCKMGSYLPKGIIPLTSGRRNLWLHWHPPLVANQTPCWSPGYHYGYRSPYPPGLVLHFKPPTLAFWPLSLPQTSLFPNTLYNDKDPPSPQLSSLILQIALAMSSLFFFLPALDSSRCFWIFSLFYLQ